MERTLQISPTPGLILAMLLAATVLAAPVRATSDGDAGETFHYRWHLGGVGGVVAGLFLPSRGKGVLRYEPDGTGAVTSELLITSKKSEAGEFWRYGSRIELDQRTSVEAWSSYRWRGEEKSKHQEIELDGVRDIVAGIYDLRHAPPVKPRPMEIWSDGKIYPVVVIPRGRESRTVGGEEVEVRHLEVRGIRIAGRDRWKGSMELWLTTDRRAIPVEIRLERSLASLRLELEEAP